MSRRQRIRPVTPDGLFRGTVVIDTREQQPYHFTGLYADAADGGKPLTVPVVRGTLASGDYSLAGHETAVAVERKSLADLFGTLAGGRDRFVRELERLAAYRFAAVIVEASWQAILDGPPHSQLPPKTVFRSVVAWQQRYPAVHWWTVENRRMAEVTTYRILERYWKEHSGEGGDH